MAMHSSHSIKVAQDSQALIPKAIKLIKVRQTQMQMNKFLSKKSMVKQLMRLTFTMIYSIAK